MSITISSSTKAKATLKLVNHISSYLFEQEYGELEHCSPEQKQVLKDAIKVLTTIIHNNK